MIDLTSKFNEAIEISRESFSEAQWYSALVLLLTEAELTFIWDDIDDRWIKIGNENSPQIMAARSFPLIFAQQSKIVQIFNDIYKNNFIYELYLSNVAKNYCVKSNEVPIWFSCGNNSEPWCNEFSLEDLFYETH